LIEKTFEKPIFATSKQKAMAVTKLKRKAAKNKTKSRLRNQGLTKATLGSYKNESASNSSEA